MPIGTWIYEQGTPTGAGGGGGGGETPPPAGGGTAPPITDFTLTNPRHEWQPDGTLIAMADLHWSLPSSTRYGGVIFYRTGVDPPREMGRAAGLVGDLTMQVIDWPKEPEAWEIVAITVDYNNQMSDDPANPDAATPRVTWNIGPPGAGGSGQEVAPIGGAANATITTEQELNSDGVVMMRHKISGWTNPEDNAFGGMSIGRVIAGQIADPVYWDAAKGATTFTTPWEPAPSARTWDFYFVSRDMAGRRNSILPGITPRVTHSFVPMEGDIIPSRLPEGWWNEEEFQWPGYPDGEFQALQFVAKKIYVGSILRVGGGNNPGITDPSFKGFEHGQIAVYNSNNVLRAWLGEKVAGTPTGPRTVFGGWFAELYVGGDDPSNAPLYADNNGVVIVGGFDVAGSRYPRISIRNEFGVEVGRVGAKVGQEIPEAPNIAGAWFKEIAIGGQSIADWRILARRDASNAEGGDLVDLRNINRFTINYKANYTHPTNPTNSPVTMEFGADKFVASGADSRYWKFPGLTINKTGTNLGTTLVDRGLILKDAAGYKLVDLVIFNGDQFGGDAGVFSGYLVLYSAQSKGANVTIRSGTGSGAHPYSSSLSMADEFGGETFRIDEIGDVFIKRLRLTNSTELINTSGAWVGPFSPATLNVSGVITGGSYNVQPATQVINSAGTYVGGGVNTAGPINCAGALWTQGTCRADQGYYVAGFAVINTSRQFVGSGGVNTTGAIQSANGYYSGTGGNILVIRNDGRLMATTGYAGVASEGVWCGSQDTMSFHGGLLVAITRGLEVRRHSEVLNVPARDGGYYELTFEEGRLADAKHVKEG